jgi:hypothetical protein
MSLPLAILGIAAIAAVALIDLAMLCVCHVGAIREREAKAQADQHALKRGGEVVDFIHDGGL